MKENNTPLLTGNDYVKKLEKENRELRERLAIAEKQFRKIEDDSQDDSGTTLLLSEYFDLTDRDYMYRILIENMSEGALVINDQRMIVYSNKYFADFSGYPLQKIIGADFNAFLGEENSATFSECVFDAESQKVFHEVKLKTYGRGYVQVLLSATSFRMEDELYYWVIVTDITAQKNIESGLEYKVQERAQELAASNKRLNEIIMELNNTNKYLDNFVHTIAHDLRAPVANLKLTEEVFRNSDEQQKEKLLASIHKNINRLDMTLKGLVQIIDTQDNKELSKTNLDVIGIINQVVAAHQDKIDAVKAEVIIKKNTEEKIRYIEGYIRSIIRNLLTNALKYSVAGRKPVIEISFGRTGDFFTLSVKDNGSGINLSKHGKNLFNPFQRISSKTDGMGIGLHIVNNMVTRNGGYIKVESEPGTGTEFILYLKEYGYD